MVTVPAARDNSGITSAGDPAPPVDADTVANWLRVFVHPGDVVELRAIRHDKGVDAGYFDHARLEDMARAAHELSQSGDHKGVYFTFNPVAPALLSRSP